MLITLNDAWDALPDGVRPVVLLGNGFSRSWKNEIFDYASLLEQANFGERDIEIKKLFSKLDTWDFEAVMRSLMAAELVADVYQFDPKIIEIVKADQEILKNSLLSAVSKSHPRLPSEVTDKQYDAVRKFLSRFSQIFTVNYDLLMYWARNKDTEPQWYSDDGFRKQLLWKGYGTQQDVFFLHGGLHIYEDASGVKKHAYTGETGGGIVEQVRTNLLAVPPRFPLFVSEPTHIKKKQRIDRSPYLSYCLRALTLIDEPVVVLGHSMDANDKHIFDAIKASSATQILVGVFGDEFSEGNLRVQANARAYLTSPGVDVHFFDAASAQPWG